MTHFIRNTTGHGQRRTREPVSQVSSVSALTKTVILLFVFEEFADVGKNRTRDDRVQIDREFLPK